MYFLWLFSAAVAALSSAVDGQSSCTTPSGTRGECVSIYDCDNLLTLYEKVGKTREEVQFLQKSSCGYKGNTITVCCSAACLTPEGSAGECVNIYSCPEIKNRLRPPVSQKNREYVKKAQCSGTDQYSVCCKSVTTGSNAAQSTANKPSPNTANKSTPNTANNPLEDINAICTAKQTALPPNPNSNCCGFESIVGNKIIGGEKTKVDEYPWLALIEYSTINSRNAALLCGGTLISGRYVLTAAHCIGYYVVNTYGEPKTVILGEYDTANVGKDCMKTESGGVDCTDGEVRINIEKYTHHPEYNALSKQNDIGLVRLARMAPFTDFIRPICLPMSDITVNSPPPDSFKLYAAGWGATENSTFSSIKLHVELPYQDLQKCGTAYAASGKKKDLWNKQLCAGGKLGKDTCKGDSGGPLMYKNGRYFEIAGVVSFGPTPCAQPNVPGVYSKVFAYRDWIIETISKNN